MNGFLALTGTKIGPGLLTYGLLAGGAAAPLPIAEEPVVAGVVEGVQPYSPAQLFQGPTLLRALAEELEQVAVPIATLRAVKFEGPKLLKLSAELITIRVPQTSIIAELWRAPSVLRAFALAEESRVPQPSLSSERQRGPSVTQGIVTRVTKTAPQPTGQATTSKSPSVLGGHTEGEVSSGDPLRIEADVDGTPRIVHIYKEKQ